jgi:hypothetical protein
MYFSAASRTMDTMFKIYCIAFCWVSAVLSGVVHDHILHWVIDVGWAQGTRIEGLV